MSKHLLALSIGPVQEFIAAARRTRDLWFGSHLLSELSRAAATAVKSGQGALIFPTAQDAGDDNAAVANVILAELPEGPNPKDLAKKAKDAVQQCWHKFADEAHKAASPNIHEELWNAQLGDVIEFYAAWVPVNGNYKDARNRVMRLLAGRKACRDFIQPEGGIEKRRIPKSSLDGRRESVLVRDGTNRLKRGVKGSQALPLGDGEELDAVGLVKRRGSGGQSYPSVARVAADPWLRKLAGSDEHREWLEKLKAECGQLAKRGVLSRVKHTPYDYFPYDGTAIFLSRHASMAKEVDEEPVVLDELGKIVRKLSQSPSKGGLGEPDPYLALLVADGDRMGAAISEIKDVDKHCRLSSQLALFAKQAGKIVAEHFGVCVYSGGDDVLAFLPVDKALECARMLHDDFGAKLSDFGAKLREFDSPTLSVGIAIGHFMEPLEDLRDYGQRAEKAAKAATPNSGNVENIFAERNGLAVQVHPRGGVEFSVREQWENNGQSLDMRLKEWAELFAAGELPNKLPYDLRELARQLKGWSAPAEAVQAETALLLKRKQAKKEGRARIGERLRVSDTPQALERLAQELLVSQWIAAGLRQSGAIQSKTGKEQ